MTDHTKTTHPNRWLRPARTLALAAMATMLLFWLICAALYVRSTGQDLDATLALIFQPSAVWTSAAVIAAAGDLGIPAAAVAWFALAVEVAMVGAFGSAGLVLYARKPDGYGAFLGVAFVLVGTSITGMVTMAAASVAPLLLPLVFLFSSLAFVAFAGLLYIFPDGHFAPRWLRWPALVIVLSFLLVSWLGLVLGMRGGTMFMALTAALYVAVGIGSQVYRYAHVSGPIERQQAKWAIAAFVLFLLTIVGALLLTPQSVTMDTPPTAASLAGWLAFYVAMTVSAAAFVLALANAILRHRLWNIDIIIRRTLIYGLLTGVLAVIYFGSVILLQNLLRTLTGQDSPLAVVLSTLAIAALFTPLRTRIQAAIDRRFYRRKYDAQQVLARFAITARDETDMTGLTEALAQVVKESMEPESVRVWLKRTSP
jgi:hypothetical protein